MERKFTIIDKITRQYRRFNSMETHLTVRLLPQQRGNERDPISYFMASVTALCEHALRNCDDSDMVGISIRFEVNMRNKAIGISFRRKDQLSTDVILNVWQKVTQSNSRFNTLDKLFLEEHSVKMPVGFERGIKSKGRTLDALPHLKTSIVKVKAERNCLAHALVIAIAKITNDPNYKSYRDGRKIGPVVQRLLETTGINLDRGGGCIRELTRFQEYFKDYRIVVFSGLNCEVVMFDGQVQTKKRINLLYDDVARHCHVIVNITGAMAKRYVCKACN